MAIGKRSKFQNDWKLICQLAKNMLVIYVSKQIDKMNAIKRNCTVEKNAERNKSMIIKRITLYNERYDYINKIIFLALRQSR